MCGTLLSTDIIVRDSGAPRHPVWHPCPPLVLAAGKQDWPSSRQLPPEEPCGELRRQERPGLNEENVSHKRAA